MRAKNKVCARDTNALRLQYTKPHTAPLVCQKRGGKGNGIPITNPPHNRVCVDRVATEFVQLYPPVAIVGHLPCRQLRLEFCLPSESSAAFFTRLGRTGLGPGPSGKGDRRRGSICRRSAPGIQIHSELSPANRIFRGHSFPDCSRGSIKPRVDCVSAKRSDLLRHGVRVGTVPLCSVCIELVARVAPGVLISIGQ